MDSIDGTGQDQRHALRVDALIVERHSHEHDRPLTPIASRRTTLLHLVGMDWCSPVLCGQNRHRFPDGINHRGVRHLDAHRSDSDRGGLVQRQGRSPRVPVDGAGFYLGRAVIPFRAVWVLDGGRAPARLLSGSVCRHGISRRRPRRLYGGERVGTGRSRRSLPSATLSAVTR